MYVCVCVGGAPEALFMAAPLLLLMQQDPVLAPGLTAARRYVVPFLATCFSLLVCCVASVVSLTQQEEALGYHARVVGQAKPLIGLVPDGGSVYTVAASEIMLALAPLPGALLLAAAMWRHTAVPVSTQVWAGVLCVLTLLSAPLVAAWYLAGTVMASSVLHQTSVRHTRRVSARII